jgi:beta-glucanase (GH16 family)
MEADRRRGTHLIDAAIVLLSLLLAAWVALIFVARSQNGETDAQTADEAPPQGQVAGAFRRGGDADWKLAWQDEFNQAECPSRAKWSFEQGFVRNRELQWYQPQNASCQDGVMVIEARREEKRNPDYRPGNGDWRVSRRSAGYTSASIASKFSFTYGRVEALIRIDPRPGSSPTFWMLGTGYRADPLAWPASGEADIMQYSRQTVRASVCIPKSTWCGWSSRSRPLADLGGQPWADRFHLWAMNWNARWIDIFLDGRLVNRFRVADATRGGRRNPYRDQPAFLLLSQALGGANGGDPGSTEFPVRFEADYVRVYQRAD